MNLSTIIGLEGPREYGSLALSLRAVSAAEGVALDYDELRAGILVEGLVLELDAVLKHSDHDQLRVGDADVPQSTTR